MALNAYTIYGAPLIQRKRSKDELDVQIISDSDEPWLSQPARVPNQPKTRFVPAQGDYDEHGMIKSHEEILKPTISKEETSPAVGSWYTSLPRRHADTQEAPDTYRNTPKPPSTAANSSTSRTLSAPAVSDSAAPVIQTSQRVDWFKTTPSRLTTETRTSSTLAEMLRRDPPNVNRPHEPPIYYGIGPANKGYEMLSKSGWEEGQPLGLRAGIGSAGSSRRKESSNKAPVIATRHTEEKKKEKWMLLDNSMPKLIVPHGEGGTIGDVEIIDLTVPEEEEAEESSEEEEDGSEMFEFDDDDDEQAQSQPATELTDVSNAQVPSTFKQPTAILTPIPIALKHDRKGLGASKSKKFVTHSSLALRHHIQHGALARRHQISDLRRVERERLRGDFGRGKRAYARKAKEEQRGRDQLMQFMAS